MEFKRLNENTIRCVITEHDMNEYGLDLEAFLTHSPKADQFLKHIIEEARNELGYQIKHGMVSMRLEVMEDGNISITFAGSDVRDMNNTLSKYLKELFPDISSDTMDKVVNYLGKLSDSERAEKMNEILDKSVKKTMERFSEYEKKSEKAESDISLIPFQVIAFESIDKVIEYCRAVPYKQAIKSDLYKSQNKFYLVIERYRLSAERFGHMIYIAYDFGEVIEQADEIMSSIDEHGELLLEKSAYAKLRKIGV